MKQANIILLIFCVLSGVSAQSGLDDFLLIVENNNRELQAAINLRDATKIETRTNNNPDNPFIEYGYFPGRNNAIGTKTSYSVNQSFQFPSIYSTKRKIADKHGELIDENYNIVRQNILLQAKLLYYEYIYLTKQEKEYGYRVQNAQKMSLSYNKKLQSGNASIIESNKAKIIYISLKGKHQLAKQEIRSVEKELLLINGGTELPVSELNYKVESLINLDSIKNELTLLSPEITSSREAIKAAKLETRLSKQNWLPEFQVAYEAETEPNGTYSGLRGGLSIPLWKDKNKVKLAQAKYLYSQSVSYATEQEKFNYVEKKYYEAEEYEKIIVEFNDAIIGTSDLDFIEQAFDAGQISIIEYILELSIFYDITDMLLQTEKVYYQSLSELYSYRL